MENTISVLLSERNREKHSCASRIIVSDLIPQNIAGVTPPPSERSVGAAVDGFAMLVSDDGDAIVLVRTLRRDVVEGVCFEPLFCE